MCAVLAGICLPLLPLQAGWPPPSYEAVYDVYMDGKPRLETRVSFTRTGQQWTFRNEGRGTKGLARFLGVETKDSAEGGWEGNFTLPARFSHRAKVSLKKDQWSAEFDWDTGRVRTQHEEGESDLPLERGVVDPLGLTLELQSRLHREQVEWELRVVDEDEIDTQRFRANPAADLATALGCLESIEVERVRDNNKRYSSVWYATELDFITIRMVHGKRDGNEFEMRIRELSIDGTEVQPGADCTAEE